MYIDTGTLQISNGTETIQIFGGSLTEITCSATPLPLFRLVKEGRVHDSYDQLLDLFDIEARRSGEVVTLYINGTNRSNNVTVICRNIDAPSGQVESKILFTLMLEFISKFHQSSLIVNHWPHFRHSTSSKQCAVYRRSCWTSTNTLGATNFTF